MLDNLTETAQRLRLKLESRFTFLVPQTQGNIYHYLLAATLMALALWVRLIFAPVDAGFQYVFFFPAITITAVVGGLFPGLFATIIGLVLATCIFTPPYYSISIEALRTSLWSNLVFLFDGLIISFSFATTHRYRKYYEQKLNELNGAKNRVETLNHALGEHLTAIRQQALDLHKFEAIIDSTDDAIISKSMDGIIQSWNRGAENIFGYAASEVIGKPLQVLIPDDRLNEEPEILARISRGERVEHFETVRLCKNGRLVDISATISPVIDSQGNIIGISKIARDISERKLIEQQVRQMAFYDALTKLPNRRLLNDRLSQTLSASNRSGCYGALMFLDLDNFKPLNDTHGHAVGDLLLIEAANRLKNCVREVDTVARFGGDEFVVMLNELHEAESESTSQARLVAEKIRDALSAPYRLTPSPAHQPHSAIEHCCTASIGVVLFIHHQASQDEILKCADIAMYQAKEAGRNSIRFFADL
jgi:diguanylate cyclase (GGDEF)-like protein/PAS domain S-box-containing protein